MARQPEQTMESATACDQRRTPPITLLLRAGKLIASRGQFLCVLRDASANGVKARVFHELPGGSYQLELGSAVRYRVELVWQQGGHAGFRFAQGPIDLARLVDEVGPFPKRQIRLELSPPPAVQLWFGEISQPARLCDISLHGTRIEADPGLALGQLVRIEGQDLPPLHARVRWRRQQAHGLVFHQGFQLEQLAKLAARLQLGSPADPRSVRAKA